MVLADALGLACVVAAEDEANLVFLAGGEDALAADLAFLAGGGDGDVVIFRLVAAALGGALGCAFVAVADFCAATRFTSDFTARISAKCRVCPAAS